MSQNIHSSDAGAGGWGTIVLTLTQDMDNLSLFLNTLAQTLVIIAVYPAIWCMAYYGIWEANFIAVQF